MCPAPGLHRQLGMVEETGILGGVPPRQPEVGSGDRQQAAQPIVMPRAGL